MKKKRISYFVRRFQFFKNISIVKLTPIKTKIDTSFVIIHRKPEAL